MGWCLLRFVHCQQRILGSLFGNLGSRFLALNIRKKVCNPGNLHPMQLIWNISWIITIFPRNLAMVATNWDLVGILYIKSSSFLSMARLSVCVLEFLHSVLGCVTFFVSSVNLLVFSSCMLSRYDTFCTYGSPPPERIEAQIISMSNIHVLITTKL